MLLRPRWKGCANMQCKIRIEAPRKLDASVLLRVRELLNSLVGSCTTVRWHHAELGFTFSGILEGVQLTDSTIDVRATCPATGTSISVAIEQLLWIQLEPLEQ